MRSAPVFAAALVFSACRVTEAIDPPPAAGAKAIILVTVPESGAPGIFVTAPTEAGGFEPPLPSFTRTGPVDVYAANYDVTLEKLGVSAGNLEPATSPREIRRPLATYLAKLGDGGVSAWDDTNANNVLPYLELVPRTRTACEIAADALSEYGAKLGVATSGRYRWSFEIGPTTALIGTDRAAYVVSRTSGRLEKRELDGVEGVVMAGRGGGAGVWAIEAGGALRHSDGDSVLIGEWTPYELDGGPLSFRDEAATSTIVAITASLDIIPPYEIFAVMSSGSVQYFGEAHWTRVPNIRVARPEEADIAWLSHERVAIIGGIRLSDVLFVEKSGRTSTVAVARPDENITELEKIPGFGVVAGGTGFIAVNGSSVDVWQRSEVELIGDPFGPRRGIEGLAPHSDDALFAFNQGHVLLWCRESGVQKRFEFLESVFNVIPLDGGFLVVTTEAPLDDGISVRFLGAD